MKDINIGIMHYYLSKEFANILINENTVSTNTKINEYVKLLNSSQILMLENRVFNNLENKTITNESYAMRYIDKVIKLFDVYTYEDLMLEHEKLNGFIDYNNIDKTDKRVILYESIYNLITESVKETEKIDVDKMHESFIYVLNHIMNENKNMKNNISIEDHEMVNEHVLRIAIDKFNEKYSTLNENEFNLVKTLIKSNYDEKHKIFEEYKKEIFNILENIEDIKYASKIFETKSKINEIKNNEENINENIVNLYELSVGLKSGIN